MLGSIIGDIIGSRFEFNNHRSKDFELFDNDCFVTDDSIMTLAVAEAILACEGDWKKLDKNAVKYMRSIGKKYPGCGYGSMFGKWIFSNDPKPYNSFGNGAAMRVSPCGFIAQTEKEAKMLSQKVTEVTHNHPEGIKGAEAVVIAVFMARNGASKNEIKERIENDYYKLDFTLGTSTEPLCGEGSPLDSIRKNYKFDETCQNTVPQAIQAFLESDAFEDAIRNAISIGGDSDTIACITGGIAEAFYGIPVDIKSKAQIFLNSELRSIYKRWIKDISLKQSKRKNLILTKLIEIFDNIKNAFYKKNNDSGTLKTLKPGEIIYCGVVFSDYGRIYHYRTNDTNIKEGDIVIVPVGRNNYEKEATVETIEICRKDNTPFPLEKTKEIIGLADEDNPYDDEDPDIDDYPVFDQDDIEILLKNRQYQVDKISNR
ncbi:MAG: ADP-ribosylglycohydrolase family protein [Treponema sp.]|nr:ADP-ribosylglycohydrolase family protein [Treponema sp.]